MNCERVIDQYLAHLTEDLDPESTAALQEHLARCGACREATDGVHALWAGLGDLPQERPSEALRARFYAMLEAHRHGAPQARGGFRLREGLNDWLDRWWPRQPVFQFGLALALLGAGLVLGPRLRGAPAEIEQLRSEIRSTRQLVALSLLQQRSPSERLQGVSWSYRLGEPDPDVIAALLQTLDTDTNVNVRLAAADALGQFRDRPLVRQGLVQSLARQTSPLVQIAVIDLLVELREPGSADMLRRLSTDGMIDQTVRQRAQWGLQQLM